MLPQLMMAIKQADAQPPDTSIPVALYVILGIVALLLLGGTARWLLGYWEDQAHLSEDNIELEHRVAHLNDELAHKRDDKEILRILSGEEHPTLFERRKKRKKKR